jgi:hypothetical protein
LGYTRSQYKMGRLKSGGDSPVSIDQQFTMEEWQFATTASKRLGKFEPYGGLKIFRQTAILQDNTTAEKVRGTRDGWSPYLGARFEFFPREMLVVEVYGVDEVGFAVGLALGF